MEFDYPEGATPLNAHEVEGLLPTHITTQAELDRWEQDNINEALAWIEGHKPKALLTESFMKLLHQKMFCNVWKWAGKFRQSEKNIGVSWYNISVELKTLCDDVKYWIENKTFSEDEIAARFHHRLVSIHLFPNGNGRHARLAADLLSENVLYKPPFTWGSANLVRSGDDRKKYIESLVAADRGEYEQLLEFVRS
ncbi:MAG: cell filamentation protein Fic [Planctomycetes bacterium B3_Pla]|nr:MAG: cell filamentation protein Fic [Planctomycetes bacterium B3_Pla]